MVAKRFLISYIAIYVAGMRAGSRNDGNRMIFLKMYNIAGVFEDGT